jgi:hypothetical protein
MITPMTTTTNAASAKKGTKKWCAVIRALLLFVESA